MMRKKKIKFISTINNIPNVINGFSYAVNPIELNRKLIFLFLFLFSFFGINAQIFVGDSAVVFINEAIVYVESDVIESTREKSEASIFISKGAVFTNADRISNVKIIYEKKCNENIIPEPKIFAKKSIKRKKSFAKTASPKNRQGKIFVFDCKNSRSGNNSFSNNLFYDLVVFPNNTFRFFIAKNFTIQLDYSNFHTINPINLLLLVDFHYYFLDNHRNRPPPFLA